MGWPQSNRWASLFATLLMTSCWQIRTKLLFCFTLRQIQNSNTHELTQKSSFGFLHHRMKLIFVFIHVTLISVLPNSRMQQCVPLLLCNLCRWGYSQNEGVKKKLKKLIFFEEQSTHEIRRVPTNIKLFRTAKSIKRSAHARAGADRGRVKVHLSRGG